MARPTSKVVVSIGLLNIPVRIYSATREHDTRFRQLHSECGTPINYVKTCRTCDLEVPKDQIIKGVSIGLSAGDAEPSYMQITDDELGALPLPSAGAVAVEGFIPAGDLPVLRRQKVNYLGPDRGGDKGYALLHAVLSASGQIAIGKVALRGDEQLVGIEAGPEGVLVLVGLWWADELIECNPVEFGVHTVALKEQEVALSRQLVDGLSLSTNLDAILDQSEEALRDLIERKAAGEVIAQVERTASEPADIMDTVRKMLDAAAA